MEKEIMNKETVLEEIVETGKFSGLKKGVITVSVVGVTAGLGFGIYRLVKKLIAKVRTKKEKVELKEEITEDDDLDFTVPDFDLDDDLEEETNN